MRYKATLAYDGTHYFGWQKTKTGPSIQERLEKALFQITREEIVPEAASRTDRGVHAEGQVISFLLQKQWTPTPLHRALNALLPPDIRILSIEETSPDFHPTLQAKQKEYRYRICNTAFQRPMDALYSWHFRYPLNLKLMQTAALELIGTKDFTGFANEAREDPMCTLTSIECTHLEGQRLQISLTGNRFLYKMARNLVGTLLGVGSGKLSMERLPSILRERDRKLAGVCAPARGLFLHRVDY